MLRPSCCAAAITLLIFSASAQDAPPAQPPPSPPTAPAQVSTEPSVTTHTCVIDGQTIAYTATAGTMALPDYAGKPRADVFFIAYTVADRPAGDRPITFAFNGGPGSSSVWLHLGALGPVRVDMGPEGFPPKPPYKLVDNERAWLDLTDIVFIDPVSTGYSRPTEGQDAKQFHGIEEDISSVGDFIRFWTTRNQRWASPKFLAGESYGTTRCAGLSSYLQEQHGMYISGIVMVSSILNFQTTDFDAGNDTPYWLYLPSYTATAWYHHALTPQQQARPLSELLDEVEVWASVEYLVALGAGDDLPAEARAEVAATLSRYTGLSREFIEQNNLRVPLHRFCKELLRDQGVTVGRLDSRIRGVDADQGGGSNEFDPSMSAIAGPYSAMLNDYIRTRLGYKSDHPYEILTGRVHPWNYSGFTNGYVNVATRLRDAMLRNRNLRVLFASGYYDMATPYFATEYTLAHLGLDPELRSHLRHEYYQSGHMMYIREADLAKLKADVRAFYDTVLQAPPAEPPGRR